VSVRVAAEAVDAFAGGDFQRAARLIEGISHGEAIAALLSVGATCAKFASAESGIPTSVLLKAIGEAS
jgi:hypothetical protein